MKRLIVGDIHGCMTEFLDLLQVAGLSVEDEVIAVGDVVDRGPDSPRLLEFFHQHPNARSLMGNHERKHIRSFRGEIEPALSQVITRRQLGEERYPAEIAFMATFPHFIELPEAILVHAFYEPGVPLAAQRDNVIVGTLSGDAYLRQHYDRPWYELYDGPKPIVVGHHDYRNTGEPMVREGRVYAIDTSCCRGKCLTGLLLPDFKVLSVPSRRDYWKAAREGFAAQGSGKGIPGGSGVE
jgi:serine/threonine protein phosphatase 1